MRYNYYSETEGMSDERMPGRLQETVDWKPLFSEELIEKAKSPQVQRQITECRSWGSGCRGQYLEKRTYYRIEIWNPPVRLGETWEQARMSCNCPEGRMRGSRCIHMAALMICWEKEHGPWIVKESEWDYQVRMRRLAEEKEKARQAELRSQLGDALIPALSFFEKQKEPEGLVFFDLKAALADRVTTPYHMERARELRREGKQRDVRIREEEDRRGERWIAFYISFYEAVGENHVTGILRGNHLENFYSSAEEDYWEEEGYLEKLEEETEDSDPDEVEKGLPLDEYKLRALAFVWEYLQQHPEGDQTDTAAKAFFRALEKATAPAVSPDDALLQHPAVREKSLVLIPRIIIDSGEAVLGFKLGKTGGRMFVLKNVRGMVYSYQHQEDFELTKKETIRFSELAFTDESMSIVQFLIRRVGEVSAVNEKLMYKGIGRGTALSMASALELKGAVLDGFYDAAQGKMCEYQDKTNQISEALIPIGHRDMQFHLKADRISDARGTFAGVAVSGLIPVMIKGSTGNYILNRDGLSRITPQEQELLRPFRKVADDSGYFRFSVGMQNLQEFYYRVLPQLMSSPCVEMEDHCAQEAEQYLPPEPVFTFYLDLREGELRCRCTVSYDTRTYTLGAKSVDLVETADPVEVTELTHAAASTGDVRREVGTGAAYRAEKSEHTQISDPDYHDTAQEGRVRKAICEWFSSYHPEEECFCAKPDDDQLYQFLMAGIPALEHYGQLQGTDAFRMQASVKPVPPVTMGVSVESGLMDISVTSKELSYEELAQVFSSYRLKRRYHRLKSGTFIDFFSGAQQLGEIDTLLQDMDLSTDQVIGRKAALPLYRALYLDRLLEEHDAVATTRDRTYRALIRNFRTIRDAEYEVPQALEDTIRPYQNEGFKWLKTLEGAGFGGILADEMGLGKTLQMISVILSDKESGVTKPSLVVCPASLIFNWQEEIRRFAPALRTAVMSGTLPARKKILGTLEAGEIDVLISSYDTLKRDIALYGSLSFNICVLDEAQFIKNAKAAVAKAVKVIRADHRFALTGTPIENRLSELWSIFDYLMPGFLYSGTDFTRRFETPIVKGKDEEVTQRLRKMTAPFILRRCKEDVLKDLPAKLEEVRYARITGEQQKIYDAQVLRMKGMLQEAGNAGEDKIRIFAELTRIRQICCDPSLLLEKYAGESAKREACLELIRSAMDGGHRMLVFSQFTSMLALLEQDLKDAQIPYYQITGATPKEKRLSLVHAFNEGDVPVFLISLKAGGTGLNLTGADVVIHYDPWWNLAAQNQATDRAHRIGQTKQVTVYRLILKDTIEERILKLQEAKKDLADAILAGSAESIMSMSNEELLALLG